MATDTRNTKVVALLIASMTFGAALLLWLEPPLRGWRTSAPLTAQSVEPVEDVLIEYAPAGEAVALDAYDCVVFPDGTTQGGPRGAHVRVLVVGSPDERMGESQSRSLLAVLGTLRQVHRLDLAHVKLDRDSDARKRSNLPRQARDLTDLLVKKAIVR